MALQLIGDLVCMTIARLCFICNRVYLGHGLDYLPVWALLVHLLGYIVWFWDIITFIGLPTWSSTMPLVSPALPLVLSLFQFWIKYSQDPFFLLLSKKYALKQCKITRLCVTFCTNTNFHNFDTKWPSHVVCKKPTRENNRRGAPQYDQVVYSE